MLCCRRGATTYQAFAVLVHPDSARDTVSVEDDDDDDEKKKRSGGQKQDRRNSPCLALLGVNEDDKNVHWLFDAGAPGIPTIFSVKNSLSKIEKGWKRVRTNSMLAMNNKRLYA